MSSLLLNVAWKCFGKSEKNAIGYFFNGNKGYFVLYTPPWLHEERDLVFIFIQTWRTYAVTLDHFPVAMFYTCLMTDKHSRNEYCWENFCYGLGLQRTLNSWYGSWKVWGNDLREAKTKSLYYRVGIILERQIKILKGLVIYLTTTFSGLKVNFLVHLPSFASKIFLTSKLVRPLANSLPLKCQWPYLIQRCFSKLLMSWKV